MNYHEWSTEDLKQGIKDGKLRIANEQRQIDFMEQALAFIHAKIASSSQHQWHMRREGV
ncbi:MAG: hypothetical protein AAB875_03615 [Patescibacteria group bacterium]